MTGHPTRVAIVTGAGGGLGGAVARRLDRAGVTTVCVDADAGGLEGLLEDLSDRATSFTVDVADEGAVAGLFDVVARDHGRLDLVSHNAGVGGSMTRLAELGFAEFQKVMAVNATGTFLVLRETLRAMSATGSRGAVVVTSSVRGFRGIEGMAAYVASKHAALGLVKVAAMEARPLGVRVNAVCPGLMDTGMMAGLSADGFTSDPSLRAAQPDEVAGAVMFLLSEDAAYMTGAEVVVDAGRTL